MATNFFDAAESASHRASPRFDRPLHPAGRWAFLAIIIGAIGYAAFSIFVDTRQVGETLHIGVFLFLDRAVDHGGGGCAGEGGRPGSGGGGQETEREARG